MDPLVIASGAIAILREAMLEIERAVKAGEIPVDEQQRLVRKVDLIRAGDFTAPEWKIEP